MFTVCPGFGTVGREKVVEGRGRFILKRVSEDSATFSFDMGMGSDPLANVMQGKQTRQK